MLTQPSDISPVIQWFAQLGERYAQHYLLRGTIDVERLRHDTLYGLKCFLFTWANERANAPRGFRIASVKALEEIRLSNRAVTDLPVVFRNYYGGKSNALRNPALDPKLGVLDIPGVIRLLERGEVRDAFKLTKVRGAAHKIRSFFIRDLVTLLGVEHKVSQTPANHLCCHPVDTWVRQTAQALPGGGPTLEEAGILPSRYDASRSDAEVAMKLIHLSFSASVSSLRVNQGIWYFCSNAVGDASRLQHLMSHGDASLLQNELSLMDGFLPED